MPAGTPFASSLCSILRLHSPQQLGASYSTGVDEDVITTSAVTCYVGISSTLLDAYCSGL